MREKNSAALIFLLSTLALIISVILFYNLAVYADEYNSSPVLVCGGWFWLSMYWLRLAILGLISILSVIKLFGK
jgi:hypothetical protein